jgi:hypothetical protein
MGGFKLKRLGPVMEPELGNPQEIEGALNPAAVRGPDGALYLFPRLVARGNYSRIGIARVRFNEGGDPIGVERLGMGSRRPMMNGGRKAGVAARILVSRSWNRYSATSGPRIALALSTDLFRWQRLGLATFGPYHGIEAT